MPKGDDDTSQVTAPESSNVSQDTLHSGVPCGTHHRDDPFGPEFTGERQRCEAFFGVPKPQELDGPIGGNVDAAEAGASAPSGPVPDEPGFGNYARTECANGPHRLHQIVDLVSGKAPAAGKRTGIAVDSPAASALPLTNTT